MFEFKYNGYDGKFFGRDNLETTQDVTHFVMDYLSQKEKRETNRVSKNWYYIYSEDLRIHSGAKTDDEFVERLSGITSDKLKKLVYQQIYNLALAEDIQLFFNMNCSERIQALFTPEQASDPDFYYFRNRLISESGIQAIRERLITVEQAYDMDYYCLDLLLSELGLQALREKFIPLEDASGMNQNSLMLRAHLSKFAQEFSQRGIYHRYTAGF
jgi:hypothetical protein